MAGEQAASYDVLVIGAGAAGFFAATRAAERGRRTLLLEKNHKPGVKILMSGGTRCNLTHATDARGIVEAFGAQGPFLHSALAALSPDELVAMFEAEGVATKVEPGGKIFPVSDRAVDVLAAIQRMFARSGAELALEEGVVGVEAQTATIGRGFVVETTRRVIPTEKLIIAVGGQSYPGCGTTGDGYAWAKSLGHRIVPPRPALVPLTSPAAWVHELRGVTVADVMVRVTYPRAEPGAEKSDVAPQPRALPGGSNREVVAERRGSFLFTHFGLSGPAPMDVSRAITAQPNARGWQAVCDFLPAQKEAQLLDAWAKEATAGGKRGILSTVSELVPRRLAEALFAQARVPSERRFADFSRAEKAALVAALKRTAIPIDGSLGFKKAEVTAGGVDLGEVDSRTMESKLVPGLHFAGEILDLDGPIGGYNFQAAFSTGWLAGEKV